MDILQFIVGFIMGIYLIEIVTGHLATKTVLAALKIGDSHTKGGEGKFKNFLNDNSNNG
jgi:hypothetical protein